MHDGTVWNKKGKSLDQEYVLLLLAEGSHCHPQWNTIKANDPFHQPLLPFLSVKSAGESRTSDFSKEVDSWTLVLRKEHRHHSDR